MALKMMDGKETRVPGKAIVGCLMMRDGTYGLLDGMGFREFQKLPLLEREGLLAMARGEKAESEAKIMLSACNAHQARVEAYTELGLRHLRNGTMHGWAHPSSWYDDPHHNGLPYVSEPTLNCISGKLWEKSCVLIEQLKKLKDNTGALKVETVEKIDTMIGRMNDKCPIIFG